MKRLRIEVKGVVQGVGFRPFVYGLATRLGLAGHVMNVSTGVVIEIEGDDPHAFVKAFHRDLPPLAQVYSTEVKPLPLKGSIGFAILNSQDGDSFTHVSADIAVCDDCLGELRDPADRRYRYPFINCTNCGPRYTITKRVPYDRPNTTMAVFTMCPQCNREYHDPADRRFHAQPNACPVCGPRVWLMVTNPRFGGHSANDSIEQGIDLLRHGAILAIKGLGGFHLCCDGTNADAIARLRVGKQRRNKPFGLMVPTVAAALKFCEVSPGEAEVLADRRRPIVLLRKKWPQVLPEPLAPHNRSLGFMLPYTPLHHLLFESAGAARLEVLVMTSGNLSEEPIVIDNNEAVKVLSGIADAFLLHDRDIFMRVDDSVVMVEELSRQLSFVRRARGFVPEAIALPGEGPEVLGCGADIKNAFTVTKEDYAIVSQHIGDMENLETVAFYEESLANLSQVYRVCPVALAYDLHPDYASTRWAQERARLLGVPGYGVQHHHAHIAAVMAEKGIRDEVIGVAFDGTGYGTDGTLWGGEFLIASPSACRRAGHLDYVALPGGEQAIRQCWRIAVSCLTRSIAPDQLWNVLTQIGFNQRYGRRAIELVLSIIPKNEFSPRSSGAGRLFDAVAALTGICDRSTFEGEAAIALESLLPPAASFSPGATYPFMIIDGTPCVVDTRGIFRAIPADLAAGIAPSIIALRFHNTIIRVIEEVALKLSEEQRIWAVALSGGCFQNEYLLKGAVARLSARGLKVHTHEKVPANDGCISLGQAYIVREIVRANGV